MNHLGAIGLNNFGYIRCRVPDDVRRALSDEIEMIQSDGTACVGAKLPVTGRPTDGVWLGQSLEALGPFLLKVINAYDQTFDYISGLDWLTGPAPYEFSDVWVNFQRKHDYVPPHVHGGILSYVIWVRIPYDIEAEMAEFPAVPPEDNTAASFNFMYPDTVGRTKIHTVRLTTDNEWEMVMFPSSMVHFVNPFRTSDDVRVSVSGNIRLKV